MILNYLDYSFGIYDHEYLPIQEKTTLMVLVHFGTGPYTLGDHNPAERTVMHKYEDYEKTHMSIFKQGGGAINCLSHQIDLINYLIGKPVKVISKFNKASKLRINVEDNLHAILFYKNSRKFTLNINFLKSPPRNFIFMEFQNGSVEWDYHKNYISVYNNKTKKIFEKKFINFKRNDMFEEQNKEIVNLIINKKINNKPFDVSLNTLNLTTKLKK